MGESNDLTFRNAGLGGFNKKDVIAYIEKLTAQFRQTESSNQQAYSALEKEAASLRDTVSSLQKELQDIKARLSKQDELLAESESLKQKNRALSDENQRLLSENKQLSDSFLSVKEELVLQDEKLAVVSREKQAIADLEIAAKLRAEQIKKDSHEQIALMFSCCQQSFDDASEAFKQFRATASEMIDSTKKQIESIDSLFSDVNNRLTHSRSTIDGLASKFSENPE